MAIQLHLVDFPPKHEKFWMSHLKNGALQILPRTQLALNNSDQAKHDVYLFYIKDNADFKAVHELANQSNFTMPNYGLFFATKELLEQQNLAKISQDEKVVLLTYDNMALNLGSVLQMNHLMRLQEQEVNLGSKFKNKIQELSSQFDVAIERLEKQLMLARQKFFAKDHSKPIKFNAIQFDYTYRAGNKPGTEYSDFIFWGEWALWLNFSSTSYADASVLLKFVEDCRKEKDYWKEPTLMEVLKLFHKTIGDFEHVMHQKVAVDYFICLVNAKQRTADYVSRGEYECLDAKGSAWPVEKSELKLYHKKFLPGEKFLMLTPGLFRNIMSNNKKNSLRNYVKANLNILNQSILTELVLILEQDHSNFLDYDMNVVYGEIAKLSEEKSE